MNQYQITEIQKLVEEFESLNINKEIGKRYKPDELEAKVNDQYTINEMVILINKVFAQFREELNGLYIKALPFQYNFNNEYGGGSLNNDLTYLISYLRNGQLQNIIEPLNRLIQYQAVSGIWEKQKRKYFRAKEEDLIIEQQRISLISESLDSANERRTEFINRIEKSCNEVEEFLEIKRKEISEIESLLAGSRNHAEEINLTLNQATVNAEKISSIYQSGKEKTEEIKSFLSEEKDNFKAHNSKSESVLTDFENTLDRLKQKDERYEDKLNVVEGKTDYFEERNNYLNDLIGREVGASLFETFKQRKSELSKPVEFWRWVVPISAVLTVFWIFFLFGDTDLKTISLYVFAVNSLKSIPAVFLLLFSISQYTKERNFQEEYAFKSAVALTVNSYADQLKNNDNKDKLILESVMEIYRSPVQGIKQSSDTKINNKQAFDTINNLIDTAKELVRSSK
ncbi:hypothetical protein [Endozoicomonas arenosclerae]|uniref:hypothetical protein n=1 Tax=Endozoicomonas arenosclerae TaxID=1633495 RepID=UPI000783E0A8|nr:hypothetical protein [Endozoicomonas arenosclerae]